MILHLYFARRFLATFAAVAGIFLVILVLINLVDQVRRFDGDGLSFAQTFGLTLLSVPETLYAILPLLMIIATLSLYVTLARTSELVVARAAGRSALRSLVGPLSVALVVGIVSVTLLNPIVAATAQRYDMIADRLSGQEGSALSLSDEGLWLRQGDGVNQTVIRAAAASADGTRLEDVSFVGFDGAARPSFRIDAETAILRDGEWRLIDAKEWTFDSPNPEQGARTEAEITLPSDLTSDRIADSFAQPSEISIWDLPAFIDRLERAGFSARSHRVWFQMELAQPLLLVSMVLVGAAFTMRHTRFGRTGAMVLSALGMGFALFYVRNFAQVLGEIGQLPIAMAAWGPPVAAILLPLGLVLHWEDG